MGYLRKIKDRFGKFADQTSIHGIGDFQKASTVTKQVFWATLLIAALAVAVWEIIMVLEDYRSSPVITTYELVSQKRQKFPKIEICLNNMVNKQRVLDQKLAPILVNYAILTLPDYAPETLAVEKFADAYGVIRANPMLFPISLQRNREHAVNKLQILSGQFNLTYEQKVIGFAQVEAEIAEALKINQRYTQAHFTIDTLKKIQQIVKIIEESVAVSDTKQTDQPTTSSSVTRTTTKAENQTPIGANFTADETDEATTEAKLTTEETSEATTEANFTADETDEDTTEADLTTEETDEATTEADLTTEETDEATTEANLIADETREATTGANFTADEIDEATTEADLTTEETDEATPEAKLMTEETTTGSNLMVDETNDPESVVSSINDTTLGPTTSMSTMTNTTNQPISSVSLTNNATHEPAASRISISENATDLPAGTNSTTTTTTTTTPNSTTSTSSTTTTRPKVTTTTTSTTTPTPTTSTSSTTTTTPKATTTTSSTTRTTLKPTTSTSSTTTPKPTTTSSSTTTTTTSTTTTKLQLTTTMSVNQVLSLILAATGYQTLSPGDFLQGRLSLTIDATREEILNKVQGDAALLSEIDLSLGASHEEIIERLRTKVQLPQNMRRKREIDVRRIFETIKQADINIWSNAYLKELVMELYGGGAPEPTIKRIIRKLLKNYENQKPIIDVFAGHYVNVKKYVIDLDTGNLDIEKLFQSIGYTAAELMGACYFINKEFDCPQFTKSVFDQQFGQCFLLDMNQDQLAGGMGLNLELTIKTLNAWPDLPPSSDGINIRVDNEFNPMSLQSFKIPAGAEAQINFQATHYLLTQSEKYGRCRRDMPRNFTTFQYSDLVCRLECGLITMIEQCGCVLGVPKRFIKPGVTHPICAEVGKLDCLLRIDGFENEKVDKCLDNCRPSCEYYDYSPVVTYSNYPSKQKIEWEKRVENSEPHSKIRLLISYSSMEYMKVEQKDAMSVHGFISQIGGQLGLFLGASALSLAQILVYCIFCSCDRKQKVANEFPEKSAVYEAGFEPAMVPQPTSG